MVSSHQGSSFEPMWRRWPADLETPLSTWLKVGHGRPYGFLLESVEGGDQLGRWSFVASDPLWVLTSRAGNSTLTHRDGNSIDLQGNPFQLLREQLKPYQTVPIPHLPPVGQLFGFWGYELIQWIEPTVPVHPRANDEPPDGCWMLCDSLLVFDQVRRQITAISYANIVEGQDPNRARAEATQRLEALEERLHQPLPAGISPLQWQEQSADQLQVTSNTSQAAFEAAVSKAEEHIAAGDVFQLVLSQRLEAKVQRDPFDLYRSLRMVNPSPFMGFFSFNGWFLIGSSPEVMVKADPQSDGSVKASVRPIAGTRPRGETTIHDLELEKELLADPKERAEHVMLVDLGRNDLGRVCEPGSVAVQELMVIERYSHVMHIVSQVEGLLRSDCDVWDLLQASFPAGTVSGAPKIRAMQLINELEPSARGPYSGVYGAMDLSGALNTAITIRTMVVCKDGETGWRVQVQAGAGIVADSNPSAEYEETLNKARGLLKALACLS
ncbi:anthranilate synthase component I family protein [Synechococcus lacustris]|uniref:anthranilate synthase component I family protein n=1 Tax=Synechococcus lacustris TaxID=2116544 RepID=UPI0020CBD2F5|nr:anthranilate synthase component I family protein [Synechococcus lacustris]MCP9794059.1 anthranilate synthase component I family protein [Synechococcus lacustris L1F-Slac]MCP9813068.1 anthranilate synthase component I family protein [Synechococcus lacustris L1E-Slac]